MNQISWDFKISLITIKVGISTVNFVYIGNLRVKYALRFFLFYISKACALSRHFFTSWKIAENMTQNKKAI